MLGKTASGRLQKGSLSTGSRGSASRPSGNRRARIPNVQAGCGADGAASHPPHRFADGKPTEMKHGACAAGCSPDAWAGLAPSLSLENPEGDLVWYTAHRFFPVFAQNGKKSCCRRSTTTIAHTWHRGGTTADTACEPELCNELSSTGPALHGRARWCRVYHVPHARL